MASTERAIRSGADGTDADMAWEARQMIIDASVLFMDAASIIKPPKGRFTTAEMANRVHEMIRDWMADSNEYLRKTRR